MKTIYDNFREKYYNLFQEDVPFIIGISTNHPKYIQMIEYCLQNGTPANSDIISMFFKNEEFDLINENEEAEAMKYFNTGDE